MASVELEPVEAVRQKLFSPFPENWEFDPVTIGNLTIYKRQFGGFERFGDDVLVARGTEALVYRSRRTNKVDNRVSERIADWLIKINEGPTQYAGYRLRPDGVEQLDFGFIAEEANFAGRGGFYNANGDLVATYINWDKIMGGASLPNLSPLVVERVDRPDAVHIVSTYKGEPVERIILPRHVDPKWFLCILDFPNEAIYDPSLPYGKWFNELGIQFSQSLSILRQEDRILSGQPILPTP